MKDKLIKIAKFLFAENIKDILIKYLKTKNISEQEINSSANKLKLINPNIQRWFVKNFIKSNKNIQDLDILIQTLDNYKNLSQKYHKKIIFNDESNFTTLYDFINQYEQKQNRTFKAPTYCKLILESQNYKFYYANARDEKCYQQLHQINNGYANWCVILGTVDWGDYTTTKYPFYIYGTKKDNTPVILFNFGNNDNAQIKDIYDNTFTQYNKQLIDDINNIAEQYEFTIKKKKINYDDYDYIDDGGNSLEEQDDRPEDYKLLNDIDEMITDNSDWRKQDIQSNNLLLYKKVPYFIITNKNKQIQFIFKEETNTSGANIIKYGKEKFSSQELLQILIEGRFNKTLEILIWKKYINQKSNKNIVQQIIKYQLKYDYKALNEELKRGFITQKDLLEIIANKLIQVVYGKDKIFELSKDQAKFDLLQFNLLDQNKITQYIDYFADANDIHKMKKVIELARNKSTIHIFKNHMQVYNQMIDLLITDEFSDSSYALYSIIEADYKMLSKQNWIKILNFFKNQDTTIGIDLIKNIIKYRFKHQNYDNQTKKLVLDNTIKWLFDNHYSTAIEENLSSFDEFTLNYIFSDNEIKHRIDMDGVIFVKYASNIITNIIIKYDLKQWAQDILSKQTVSQQEQKKLVQYFIKNKMDNTMYYLLDNKRIKNENNRKLIDDYFGTKLKNK